MAKASMRNQLIMGTMSLAVMALVLWSSTPAGAMCEANAAAPTFREGAMLGVDSCDLKGNRRVAKGTTDAGEDVAVDVMKVEQRFAYTNITLAAPTTTVIKSGAGFLHLITFNKPVATGTLTCYDNTAASGTLIGTITTPASPMPVTLHYDVTLALGLTCVTATAAQDITVSWR